MHFFLKVQYLIFLLIVISYGQSKNNMTLINHETIWIGQFEVVEEMLIMSNVSLVYNKLLFFFPPIASRGEKG